MKVGDIVLCKKTVDIRDFPCDPPYPEGLWKPNSMFSSAVYSFYKNEKYEVLEYNIWVNSHANIITIGIGGEYFGYFILDMEDKPYPIVKSLPLFKDFFYDAREIRKIKLNELVYKPLRKDKLLKIWQ